MKAQNIDLKQIAGYVSVGDSGQEYEVSMRQLLQVLVDNLYGEYEFKLGKKRFNLVLTEYAKK